MKQHLCRGLLGLAHPVEYGGCAIGVVAIAEQRCQVDPRRFVLANLFVPAEVGEDGDGEVQVSVELRRISPGGDRHRDEVVEPGPFRHVLHPVDGCRGALWRPDPSRHR